MLATAQGTMLEVIMCPMAMTSITNTMAVIGVPKRAANRPLIPASTAERNSLPLFMRKTSESPQFRAAFSPKKV